LIGVGHALITALKISISTMGMAERIEAIPPSPSRWLAVDDMHGQFRPVSLVWDGRGTDGDLEVPP
jgi:hypothetical protein